MSRFEAYPPRKSLVLARQRMERAVEKIKNAAKSDSQPPEPEKTTAPESRLLIFCSLDDDSDDFQL